MKKAKKIWDFILDNFINIIFIILMIYYIVSCSIYVYGDPSFKCVGISIVFIFINFLLYKFAIAIQNKNEKLFKIFILFLSIILYMIWGFYAKTPPVSDYEILYEAAIEILKGNFSVMSFDKTNYFYWWNFQAGYAVYLSIIMRFLGTSLISMKIYQIIIMAITNLLIYETCKKMFNKKFALITTMLFITFTFIIGGSSIINNQHDSFFFIMLSIFFYTKSDKLTNKIIAGLFIGIAYILRQTVIIVLVAFICFEIWKLFKNQFRNWKKVAIAIILLFIPYYFVINTFDNIMVRTKLIPNSAIKSNCPYFKLILGLQWQNMHGEGTYDDLKYYNFDYDEYNIQAKNYVLSKYKNHFLTEVLPFWSEKMVRFAGTPDSQIDWSGNIAKNRNFGHLMKYYGYSQYILCIVLSLFTAILLFKNKIKKSEKIYWFTLFEIIFIGFFMAYILVEVQSRYRYEQYITLAIMATPALILIFDYFDRNTKKIKNIKITI